MPSTLSTYRRYNAIDDIYDVSVVAYGRTVLIVYQNEILVVHADAQVLECAHVVVILKVMSEVSDVIPMVKNCDREQADNLGRSPEGMWLDFTHQFKARLTLSQSA